jgi:hypothetical protein
VIRGAPRATIPAVKLRSSPCIVAFVATLTLAACGNTDSEDASQSSGGAVDPGGRAKTYCENSCDCGEDPPKGCVEDCTDGLGENLRDAQDLGCDDEYRDYLTCLGDTYRCEDDVTKICLDELARSNDACND